MLTVKVYDGDGSRSAYECNSYKLVPAGAVYEGSKEDHPRLFLSDVDGDLRTVIAPVSDSTVYVMNDGGQTIDTMRFNRAA